MEEKKYLKLYNKVGYGGGDFAANMVYGLISSFVMIYLTNTIGMDAGIIGTLILVSKLLDGVTDILFGSLIDRTHSKFGKARPWMFWSYFGNAIALIALFAIPMNLSSKLQYAYFFIAYTLLNAIFYTANNIAYSALTSLITKNSQERVQMGTFHTRKSSGFQFHFSYGGEIWRRKCWLENNSDHLCINRSCCKYHFRIIRKRASGRRDQ